MSDFPNAAFYSLRWQRWAGADTTAEPGRYLVCAYHIDNGEVPSWWIEVDSADEARHICAYFDIAKGDRDLDFCVAYDDQGKQIANGGFGAE